MIDEIVRDVAIALLGIAVGWAGTLPFRRQRAPQRKGR